MGDAVFTLSCHNKRSVGDVMISNELYHWCTSPIVLDSLLELINGIYRFLSGKCD